MRLQVQSRRRNYFLHLICQIYFFLSLFVLIFLSWLLVVYGLSYACKYNVIVETTPCNRTVKILFVFYFVISVRNDVFVSWLLVLFGLSAVASTICSQKQLLILELVFVFGL